MQAPAPERVIDKKARRKQLARPPRPKFKANERVLVWKPWEDASKAVGGRVVHPWATPEQAGDMEEYLVLLDEPPANPDKWPAMVCAVERMQKQ